MKLKSIHIENFRSFRDETINLNPLSCFGGPNGAGKSSILAALNVFFSERTAVPTDRLTEEDYFQRDTTRTIRITLTFEELDENAQAGLAAYARQGEVTVTAEAKFDPSVGHGVVRHYGQRLAMKEFARFFDAEKAGGKVAELNPMYEELRTEFTELPGATSKDAKIAALQAFEARHPENCVLIPSADDFYGANSTGKLAEFVQWVYVPAVKDAGEEALEGRHTALGKLIARAVTNRTTLETQIDELRADTLNRYQELLNENQEGLRDLSRSLAARLETWAHAGVHLDIEWQSDPAKAVAVAQPTAGIKTGEGGFIGSLSRMGHGLQRSYLLALLQELADSESVDAPTLLLGCEEPELYQHPPQARHLANVLETLVTGNAQVLVTTHSPLFVSGDGFENTRLVRRAGPNGETRVSSVTFVDLCERIREARGDDQQRPIQGMVAKIHQALQPGIAEMFFARVPVLVEGLEDVSYITTHLHLTDRWSEFRRLGCHLIPANGKDKLIQPLAIAIGLGLPAFVIFDSDGHDANQDRRNQHERDNKAIISLLGVTQEPFPDEDVVASNFAMWKENLGLCVKADFGSDYERLTNAARVRYVHEGGLEKNDLFIADWLSEGDKEEIRSGTLDRLCEAILAFARSA